VGVEDRSELRDRLGQGRWQCSELSNSPGEQVHFGLAQEHWPAEHLGQLGRRWVVRQCSELGDSPVEQVRFGLAQEHWPNEHFGKLGQRLVVWQFSELGDSPGEQVRFGLGQEHCVTGALCRKTDAKIATAPKTQSRSKAQNKHKDNSK